MRDPAVLFSENLTYERTRRALSMRALAKRAGMEGSEISRLERGDRDPRLSTIVRLARALELSLPELLRGIDGEGPVRLEPRRDRTSTRTVPGPVGHDRGR
jgi:transcriptional regulator with XRE-family HTH domain